MQRSWAVAQVPRQWRARRFGRAGSAFGRQWRGHMGGPAPWARGRAARTSRFSLGSIMSVASILSLRSAGSILSIGSIGSVLSIGSAGSILSIGSVGSILCIGSAGSVLRIGGRRQVGNRQVQPEQPQVPAQSAERATPRDVAPAQGPSITGL